MPAALERELERLYRLPLPEFTAARNELAKRLRAEGNTDEAEQVKALKKPSVAVWLANQLAHQDEVDVQRLLRAGESLTRTPAQPAGDRSSDGFLEARREEQRALERLARVARDLAAQQGIGASAVERTMQTLRAASLTEEGRRQLKQGRLTEELEPPGFEALTRLSAPAPRRREQRGSKSEERRVALKEAREALRRARAEQRELEAAARAAAREAKRAEDEAVRRRREADEARAAADAAAQSAAEAEAAISSASTGRPRARPRPRSRS